MKFLGDMGISPRTIALLREQGYDAIHLIEENLEKMTDPNILEKARQDINDYATELTNGVIISVRDVSIRLRYLPI